MGGGRRRGGAGVVEGRAHGVATQQVVRAIVPQHCEPRLLLPARAAAACLPPPPPAPRLLVRQPPPPAITTPTFLHRHPLPAAMRRSWLSTVWPRGRSLRMTCGAWGAGTAPSGSRWVGRWWVGGWGLEQQHLGHGGWVVGWLAGWQHWHGLALLKCGAVPCRGAAAPGAARVQDCSVVAAQVGGGVGGGGREGGYTSDVRSSSRQKLTPANRPCRLQYAQWEEQQKDFRRARSVWERALDVDHRNISIWLKCVPACHVLIRDMTPCCLPSPSGSGACLPCRSYLTPAAGGGAAAGCYCCY